MTKGDTSKQPTGSKATHVEGKYSQTSLKALQTDQQSALSDKENANQQKTSAVATSSAVAQQHGGASSSLEDVVALAAVDATWKMVDEQCAEEMRRREEASTLAAAAGEGKATEGWKTIRVFVSSTFADMHSEREILVKKVL